MNTGRHVTPDLAFHDGSLSADRARAVETHLTACLRCRKADDEIRFGIALAGLIARGPAPVALWGELEKRLDAPATMGPSAGVRRRLRRALAYAAVIVLAATAGFGLWYYGLRERLEIATATATPSAFEVAAHDAHARRLAGRLEFDYVTTSPGTMRAWIRRQAGIEVNLAIERPPEDAGRFRLLGAKIIQAGGARAALVGYEVDSHPVTLLSAPLSDVQDPPPDVSFKKRVAWRLDAEHGVKLLTWGASGQAYVLVTDLPGRGTDACSICHTAPDRRKLIREATSKSGT